jgi:hypothetical protein
VSLDELATIESTEEKGYCMKTFTKALVTVPSLKLKHEVVDVCVEITMANHEEADHVDISKENLSELSSTEDSIASVQSRKKRPQEKPPTRPRRRSMTIDGERIYFYGYPKKEWELVQETLRRHVQEIKSNILDQDSKRIDWNVVLNSRSVEISSNLRGFMKDVAEEDAKAVALSKSAIESILACIDGIAKVHPSEQTRGKFIRESYIANNWDKSSPGNWQKIQDQIRKNSVTKHLHRRFIAWCTNKTNSMENRKILDEVSHILIDLEKKGRACVRGLIAISLLRKMGLWKDYVISACANLRVRKEGSYCNGEHITILNRAGNRPE